jgi:hypothetical protein
VRAQGAASGPPSVKQIFGREGISVELPFSALPYTHDAMFGSKLTKDLTLPMLDAGFTAMTER